MLTKCLKAAWDLSLPALGLCCLILTGCGNYGPLTVEFDDDSITINPGDVELSTSDESVPVKVEWKPLKESIPMEDFKEWYVSTESSQFEVSIASQRQPSTTLSVKWLGGHKPVASGLHAGPITHQATVYARRKTPVTRSRNVVLVIHGFIPQIKYSFIGLERKEISPQEMALKSTVAVEVLNDKSDVKYTFDISFFPGAVYLCSPGATCLPQPLGGTPAVTMRPTIAGKAGAFQFEQTVKTSPPHSIGTIECNFAVRATSDTGGGVITGRTEKILYR